MQWQGDTFPQSLRPRADKLHTWVKRASVQARTSKCLVLAPSIVRITWSNDLGFASKMEVILPLSRADFPLLFFQGGCLMDVVGVQPFRRARRSLASQRGGQWGDPEQLIAFVGTL